MQTNKEKNLIVELTFGFALKIIKYVESLEKERKFVMATQLLKAGTSIGANVREAQNAESKIDFIHKMKIAAKEADFQIVKYYCQIVLQLSEYCQKLSERPNQNPN